jgi:uncharacterized protein (TIGR01777 family)
MNVVITGATGTIGRAVVAALSDRGEHVVALSRDREGGRTALGDRVEVHEWRDPVHEPPPPDALRGAGAVVHLLGARIDQRWTPSAKRAIRDSRVESTRRLVDALRALPDGERPAVLVSQSATGYYGPSDERPLAEDAPPGDDFLAGIVRAWEAEAQRAAPALRVAVTRTGVVLSRDGGALGRMLPFFRLGIGGPVAGGRQYLPWVHLDDVVAALLRCVDDERVSGPINVTAPQAATNREFSHALGRVLHRPAVLPVPGFALRALYGEMAQIVLTGQHAVPRRLQALGHEFRRPELEPALRDVLA